GRMAKPLTASKRLRQLRSPPGDGAGTATGGAARNGSGAAARQMARVLAKTRARHWTGPASSRHCLEAAVARARGPSKPYKTRTRARCRPAQARRGAAQLYATIAEAGHTIGPLVAGPGLSRARA